jgi:hypothetical protein
VRSDAGRRTASLLQKNLINSFVRFRACFMAPPVTMRL